MSDDQRAAPCLYVRCATMRHEKWRKMVNATGPEGVTVDAPRERAATGANEPSAVNEAAAAAVG